MSVEPAARIKVVRSIVEKLRRGSTRLSRIQDIAGCRFTTLDVIHQNMAVQALQRLYPGADVTDRRFRPSHGYRAVHVIPMIDGKPVEIQVRTMLQHLWANFSERIADSVDPAVKYGGGPAWARDQVAQMASRIAQLEQPELAFAAATIDAYPDQELSNENNAKLIELRRDLRPKKEELRKELSGRLFRILLGQQDIM
jgi:ppGpp synthetase/RelA/SpoT-type nucleotidyltranferase